MSNKVVFDSSALIALFAKEKGIEIISQHLNHAIMSSVNIAEVYKHCLDIKKLAEDEYNAMINMSGVKIIDFSQEQALITARIYPKTKNYGLSLGDRACISLAIERECPILTCDKIWAKTDLGVEFIMAR